MWIEFGFEDMHNIWWFKKGPTKENDCSWLVTNSDWFRWWYLIISQFVLSIFSSLRKYWHSYHEVFLVRILWCSQTSETSDHSKNNLAKFGYILDTKVEKKEPFSIPGSAY